MKLEIKELLKKKTIMSIDYLVLLYVLYYMDGLANNKDFEDIYMPFCAFALSYCANEKDEEIKKFFIDDGFVNLLKDCMEPIILKQD